MPSEHDHAEPLNLALDRANTLLLVVDVQERLVKAMPEAGMGPLVKNLETLIKAARRLGVHQTVRPARRTAKVFWGLVIADGRGLAG